MKKTQANILKRAFIICISSIIILYIPVGSFGQNLDFLYVVPRGEQSRPGENSIYTNNKLLDSVLRHYEVTAFRLAFPQAKHPELAATYCIHAMGDIYKLKEVLESSDLFKKIELQGYSKPASCPNPVPINDPFTVYGYNQTPWQLEMIEAGCAWEITDGDPDIIIGIPDTEFRTTHEDFSGKFVSVWNPAGFTTPPECHHGTEVSSMAAANVNNYIGVAGIGHKCRLAGYVVPTRSGSCIVDNEAAYDLGDAVWQAYLDERKIINVSWTGVGNLSPTRVTAVKQIVSNGTTLVVAAGNDTDDVDHWAYADVPGVINVSNVNIENKLGPTNCARNQWVDICAPGFSVFTVSSDGDNQYTESWGTSFSAPGVAGTVGLMLSINPCLSPAQVEAIIKATADPVTDGYLYPGLHGAGRLNAYEAVKAAQEVSSSLADYHLRDSDLDYGAEPNASTEPYWISTDMWMRKVDDGIEEHQNIPYDALDPTAWIYARIRNIGCWGLLGDEKIQLYWAHASATQGWNWPWNGISIVPDPPRGGLIGEVSIPPLLGGDEVIVKVKWNNIPNPAIYNTGYPFPTNPNPGFSILGRILSPSDPMYSEVLGGTAALEHNVRNNNNIALRRVQVGTPTIEPEFASLSGGAQGGEPAAAGYHAVPMSTIIGNAEEVAGTYDLEFSMPDNERLPYITELAEVRVHLDSVSWEKWVSGGRQAEGVRLINEEMFEFIVTGPVARFNNLHYEPETFSNVALTVHFLTEEFAEKDESLYELLWKAHGTGQTVGGNRFIFKHPQREQNELFFAQLESQMLLNNSAGGHITELRAEAVTGGVSYRWYTADTLTLLDTGRVVYMDDPQAAEVGILEVSSEVDGYKDYYDLSTNTMAANNTSPHYISTIAPNPASNQVTVDYHIAAASSVQSATLKLTALNNPQNVQHFTINPISGNYQIQLGALPAGVYIVSLYCDNQLCDSKGLTVQ